MTLRGLSLAAALGSLLLLLGAYGFQHIGGLAPCQMCLWQRWPHAAAVAIGLLIWLTGVRDLAWAGAVAALTTAGIGAFHAGVEQGWWQGPTTCSSSGIGGLSSEELLDQILTAPLVRCDEIAWQFVGISMAGWNALLSIILFAMWVTAALRR